jgi:hypothetical protein
MIKERKKSKYKKKTRKQIVFEYLRTIVFSIIFSIVVTSFLAIQARNEMLENIYLEAKQQQSMDRETALKLITQTNLLKDLHTKKYAVCMNIAELYEAAGDYNDAKIVYEQAILKVLQFCLLCVHPRFWLSISKRFGFACRILYLMLLLRFLSESL